MKDVKPSAEGDSLKVKVKVRINLHGILTVSSATLVLKQDAAEQESLEQQDSNSVPEAMETESQKAESNGSTNQQNSAENSQENHIGNEVRKYCVYIMNDSNY